MSSIGVVAAVLIGIAALIWLARKELNRWLGQEVRQSLKIAQEDFLTLATQRLDTERAHQAGDLEGRKKEIEQIVKGLEQQLGRYEQLMKTFEKERDTKYGSLDQKLQSTAEQTKQLEQATIRLTSMLGNSKIRGQWGEKAADDILRLCGMQQGIHYEVQKNAESGRPDFTFNLPDKHKLYMDVKFPLDNYIRLINADGDEQQTMAHREQFIRDVRGHLKTLIKRDYAPEGSSGPNYVLMFIPNEQVYSSINQWMPGFIDESLSKRIVVCGPWTLYSQVRIIYEAWQNFYHERTLGDILTTITEFRKSYLLFVERFREMGKRLNSAQEFYQDITDKSFAQIERKIDQIDTYRKGQKVTHDVAKDSENLVLKESKTKE